MVVLLVTTKPYIILKNPLDGRYRVFDNTDEVTPYDMALCGGETIEDALKLAETWFGITPEEVEV